MMIWRNGMRGLALLAIVILAGCGGGGDGPDHVKMPNATMPTLPPPPAATPDLNPAALAEPRFDAVLVSGDSSRSVGDDATQSLRDQLATIGTPVERLHPLSADPKHFVEDFYLTPTSPGTTRGGSESREDRIRKIPGGTDPALLALALRRVLDLDGRNDGACLVYLVSTPDGQALKLRDGTITPDQLDRALGGGCANAPTVVIVSGCTTGDWAAPPMARPNRLIMTASAKTRSGFGCGPNVGFTTFDECFLGATGGAPDWATIFTRTRTCVLRREALVDQPSVDPQIYLGPQVARLPAPWRDSVGPDGVTRLITWRQGIGRFSIEGTPFYSTLRKRNQDALEAYHRAPAPKALALTLAGTVAWAADVTSAETPDDVARIALQLCEWQSDGPCMLYARGDGLAASGPSGFPPLHPPLLARVGRFDPGLVPFIRDDQRVGLASYRTQSGAKALALGPATENFAIGTGPDQAAAKAAALAACNAKGGPCVIYAEGEAVVLGYQR
jgi:hypothetical protein